MMKDKMFRWCCCIRPTDGKQQADSAPVADSPTKTDKSNKLQNRVTPVKVSSLESRSSANEANQIAEVFKDDKNQHVRGHATLPTKKPDPLPLRKQKSVRFHSIDKDNDIMSISFGDSDQMNDREDIVPEMEQTTKDISQINI